MNLAPDGILNLKADGFGIISPLYRRSSLEEYKSSEEVLSFIEIMLSGQIPWSPDETSQIIKVAKANINRSAQSSWVTLEEKFYCEKNSVFNGIYKFWVHRSNHDLRMIDSFGFLFAAAEFVKDTCLDRNLVEKLAECYRKFNRPDYMKDNVRTIQVTEDPKILLAPEVKVLIPFDAISDFEHLHFGDFPGNFCGSKNLYFREGILTFSFDDFANDLVYQGQRLTEGKLMIGQGVNAELSFAFNPDLKSRYNLIISHDDKNLTIYNNGPAHCTFILERSHEDRYRVL